MKKRYLLILFNILIYINSSVLAQDFNISNFISGSGDIRVNESVKLEDGYVLFGDFLGTLNRPEVITSSGRDIFLAKYKSDFKLDWIKHIGGTLIDFAQDIVVDSENNIYIIGSFLGTCSFDGLNELTTDGSFDVFIAKFDSRGNYLWAKKIAYNSEYQRGSTIDFDGNNLIIGGYYQTSINFDSQSFTSPFGMYYAKVDTSGTFLWAKNIPTVNTSSTLESVSVFSDGYYFNGRFKESVTFDIGNYSSNTVNYTDVFLYKTDFDGNGQWLRRTYGDDNAFTGTMTQDNYGNVYYTGYFSGTDLTVDSTATHISNQNIVNKGNTDFFVFKYNKKGNLIWNYGYGLDGYEWARDIKFGDNVFYLTGYFSDTIIFDQDTLYSSSTTDRDAFIGAIDRDGNPLTAVKLDDSNDGNESGMTISVDESDTIYWGGTFNSTTITIGDSVFVNPNPGKQAIYITKGKTPLSAVFSKKQNVSCNGQMDGKLTVTPYFGVAPYTYSWSHNGSLTDSTATGLGPGTYSVTVTDAVDSTAVVSYNLTEPDVITFNPAIINVTQCSYSEEGEIDVSVAGGNGGYQYQWLATDGGCGLALQAEDQAGLTVGTYTVTVTDSKGCTNDTTMYITGPDPITFGGTVVTDSSQISAGAIDLVYSGGFGDPGSFAFNWQGPFGFTQTTEDLSNLRPGNYEVTVTDVHLCDFDTIFNVANLDTFYTYIAKYKDACNGTINGTATVDFYSPDNHTAITYQWDANAGNQTTAQATGLAPGRYYYVTVTDTENTPTAIEMVDSVYIDELPYTFDGTLSGTTTLDCNGDSDGYIDLTITTQGTKPYTYNWSNGSTLQDLTNLGIGTYSVTVTDKYNCQFSITNYSIDQPTPVSATAEVVTTPSCNGDFDGEVTVDRSGGTAPYTYQWDDPGFQDTRNADGLDAGYYSVTVADVNGCEATSGISLTEPQAISLSKVIDDEQCNGAGEGAIALTVNGGTTPFSYSWSTNDGSGLVLTDKNQSGLTAGKYYVTATDNNNCIYEDSAEVAEPPLLEITSEAKTDVNTCNGDNTGSIEIAASGGTGALTYTLNPGAIESNSTGTFSNLTAGNYSVDVTDQNLCTVTSSSFNITEPTALTLTEDELNNVTCNGTNSGSILISVSGGTVASDYSYNWSTSDGSGISAGLQDQLALGAGTYSLSVTDDNACEITDQFTITEPTEIVVNKTIYDISCHGGVDGVIVINHTGGVLPFSYYWTTNDGSGLDPVNRNQGGLSAGTYNLEITDAIGCVVNETSVITDPPAIQIDSESSTDASGEDATDGTITVEASGGTGALTYTLKPANKTNQTGVFNAVSPGNYTVEVIDENYCGPAVSNTLTVGYANAIEDFINNDFIKIYPNPTNNKFYIELDYTEEITIEVLSLTGQSMVKEEIHPSGFIKKEIDISDEAKGIYLIRIYNDKISYKTKVILQ